MATKSIPKKTTSKRPYAVKKVAGKSFAVVKTLGGELQVNLSPTRDEARESLIALGVISPKGKRTRTYAVTAKK